MAILSDGTVVPCVELKDLVCENILESEIEDIWNSNWMKFLRNDVIPENYEEVVRFVSI